MFRKKRISDLISQTNSLWLREDSCLDDAARIFEEFDCMQKIPVINGDNLPLGVISRACLFESLVNGTPRNSIVSKIMDFDLVKIPKESFLDDIHFEGKKGNFIATDANGKFLALITLDDLLRAYQEQIKCFYQEFNIFVASAYNGIIAIDSNGIVRVFNKSAERITGIKAREIIGKNADKVLPNSRLEMVLIKGEAQLEMKQKVGSSRVLISVTPILEDDKIYGAIAVFQDLKELENVIESLGEFKITVNIFEMILEYAFEGVIVIDKNEKIVYCNKEFLEMLGMESRDVVDKRIQAVIHNSRLPIVLQTGLPEIRSSSILDENRVVNRLPIKKDGDVVGAIGMVLFKDVAELNEIYRKLGTLTSKAKYYKKEVETDWVSRYTLDDIVGNSHIMKELKTQIRRVATKDSTVLILGETGTGKELFAHAIHNTSNRRNKSFVRINCASLPRELLEAELFGYESGAFTGARREGKPGKFELANRGTIFLDEIGDMPLSTQAELLRVLEEKEIVRIGGTKPIKVDFRVIAATNQDLDKLVKENKFRVDLFYRLDIIRINLPPLRQMKDDIPLLTYYYTKKFSAFNGNLSVKISPVVLKAFETYEWPGNIRELKNLIEQSITYIKDGVIELENLSARFLELKNVPISHIKSPLKEGKADTERDVIAKALKIVNGNRAKAAKLLGIHRSGLYQKLKKYNIT